MLPKNLILRIMFIASSLGSCVAAGTEHQAQTPMPAAVSPAQSLLDTARHRAQSGDATGAVEALQALADSGFADVDLIRNDPALRKLPGDPAFDALLGVMAAKAYPCEHDPVFGEFDFWVGDWDVHLADGREAGTNSIRREQRGCLLIEEWQSATGGSGTSINYFDKADGEWVQIWNDASGSQIEIRGGLTDDGMLLKGTIHSVATGTSLPFRGLWTPLPDGRVRQYFEQADAGGSTWTPWFEGFYSRRSDGN